MVHNTILLMIRTQTQTLKHKQPIKAFLWLLMRQNIEFFWPFLWKLKVFVADKLQNSVRKTC